MNALRLARPLTGGAVDTEFAFVNFETSGGPLQVQFAAVDAAKLGVVLELAAREVMKEREKQGLHALQRSMVKKIAGYELAIDQLREVAMIRTRFVDETHQETPIHRAELQATIDFLVEALRSFEAGSSTALQ